MIDRLRAVANGEAPPPPHPKMSDPKYRGTFYSDIADIRNVGPVEDLSE